MLAFLRGKLSARKLLLFSAACKRAGNWSRLPPEWRRCAELEELYADQQASLDELIAVWRFQISAQEEDDIDPLSIAWGEAYEMAKDTGEWAVYDAGQEGADVSEIGEFVFDTAYQAAVARQCQLIREIVGNPFCSVGVDPSWLAWRDRTVEKLAKAIYEEARWPDVPVLADALEEAGCTDVVILQHCREQMAHIRGCWAVNLLLGKQ